MVYSLLSSQTSQVLAKRRYFATEDFTFTIQCHLSSSFDSNFSINFPTSGSDFALSCRGTLKIQ